MLQILDTGSASALHNMQLDAKLLDELGESPILHLYAWEKPAATYGYFLKPEEFFKKGVPLDLARRPTGGGITFHVWDLAFSFLCPARLASDNTLENYRFVNEIVASAYASLFHPALTLAPVSTPALNSDCTHYCMAQPTQYDVVSHGRKIAGSAQRRKKQGYLHQGTISLTAPDPALLEQVLLRPELVTEAMQAYTFAPVKFKDLEPARREMQRALVEQFRRSIGTV